MHIGRRTSIRNPTTPTRNSLNPSSLRRSSTQLTLRSIHILSNLLRSSHLSRRRSQLQTQHRRQQSTGSGGLRIRKLRRHQHRRRMSVILILQIPTGSPVPAAPMAAILATHMHQGAAHIRLLALVILTLTQLEEGIRTRAATAMLEPLVQAATMVLHRRPRHRQR